MVEFAPVIGLAIAFIVLLRVAIWQKRRDARRLRQRKREAELSRTRAAAAERSSAAE